jgi:hypothetical protein
MGQSRKQQLDKIFTKYPHKSPAQISKDHGIPYSTVYAYHRKFTKPLAVIEAEYKPRMPVKDGFSEAQLIWSMVISFAVGAGFTILMGVI